CYSLIDINILKATDHQTTYWPVAEAGLPRLRTISAFHAYSVHHGYFLITTLLGRLNKTY
ncbi:MAG: hypothetical protein K0U52_05840, partial [Gammaproteobacteria bacterium]|nr:hypothetical protein [Gammaproteobacteria bacterium]